MMDVNDAILAVMEYTPLLETERIPLRGALHYVLAETIISKDDIPLFDSSAMDGYGVKVDDVKLASDDNPAMLKITGVVKAGQIYEGTLEHGTAVKIFTGAKIPEGVEAVLIKERSQEIDGKVLIKSPVEVGENIRRRGEEFRRGDEALYAGVLITPPVIGFLAGLGYTEVHVYRKPKVAVIITGDELIDPQDPLEEGKIRDVNSFTIQAALQELGIETVYLRRIADDPEKLLEAVNESLSLADAIIVSGGVSVGDCDFVKEVFEKAGIEKVFWKVNIKPGKPVFFGTKVLKQASALQSGKLVFGLPGNPASILVTFYLFVRPALFRMMGRKETQPAYLPVVIDFDVRKKDERTEYLRGKIYSQNDEVHVELRGEQHSHMLGSFAKADCLVIFPKEETRISKGERAKVIPLPWVAL